MAKFKDEDEIQPATPNPRGPADQRRDNPEVLDEYIEVHKKRRPGTSDLPRLRHRPRRQDLPVRHRPAHDQCLPAVHHAVG
jgi:hypothetical protein